MEEFDDNDTVKLTLYTTPAPRRSNHEEYIINRFIDMNDTTIDGDLEKEMLTQVSNSGRKLEPSDPRSSRNKMRLQVR